MNYLYIRQNMLRPDTKFGIGSLLIAILLIKCLASLTFGSGFDKLLVSIHVTLALVGIGLCTWGYLEEMRKHEKAESEGCPAGIPQDSDSTTQTERDGG